MHASVNGGSAEVPASSAMASDHASLCPMWWSRRPVVCDTVSSPASSRWIAWSVSCALRGSPSPCGGSIWSSCAIMPLGPRSMVSEMSVRRLKNRFTISSKEIGPSPSADGQSWFMSGLAWWNTSRSACSALQSAASRSGSCGPSTHSMNTLVRRSSTSFDATAGWSTGHESSPRSSCASSASSSGERPLPRKQGAMETRTLRCSAPVSEIRPCGAAVRSAKLRMSPRSSSIEPRTSTCRTSAGSVTSTFPMRPFGRFVCAMPPSAPTTRSTAVG